MSGIEQDIEEKIKIKTHLQKYLTKEFGERIKTIHLIREKTWEIIDDYVNGNILEVGCGEYPYSKHSFKIDIINGMDLQHDLNYPFNLDKKFDTIIGQSIITDLYNPEIFLDSCYRHLKRFGLLILVEPNILYWKNRIRFLFGNLCMLNGLGLTFFTPKRLIKMMEIRGFRLKNIIPIGRIKILSLCGVFMVIGEKI